MAITMLHQSMGDNYLPLTLTVWEYSMLHQSMGMCVLCRYTERSSSSYICLYLLVFINRPFIKEMPLQVRVTSLSREENVPLEAFYLKHCESTAPPSKHPSYICIVGLLIESCECPNSCIGLADPSQTVFLKQSIPRRVNGFVSALSAPSVSL
jgi:hypothetical protein